MRNNNAYLLIGPSGIGKSSVISKLVSKDFLKFELDDVIKKFKNESSISNYFSRIGPEQFFNESIDSIDRLIRENPSKKILIDVGAGSIDWSGCTDLYLNYKIIALTCDKKVLYDRIRNRGLEKRSFKEYISSEFKPHKVSLYEHAKYHIDTTHLDCEAVANRVSSIVSGSYGFKYKPTILNIATGLFTIWAIYLMSYNWPPKNEAELMLIVFLTVIAVSFTVDIILQLILKKYIWLTVAEIAVILFIAYKLLPLAQW